MTQTRRSFFKRTGAVLLSVFAGAYVPSVVVADEPSNYVSFAMVQNADGTCQMYVDGERCFASTEYRCDPGWLEKAEPFCETDGIVVATKVTKNGWEVTREIICASP